MKKIFLFVIALASMLCIGIDCWFGYIHFFGKTKATDQSFQVSDMTITNAVTGEESKAVFCEVQVFNNAIEFKFNHFIDENSTKAYSNGIQLILNDSTKTIRDKDIFAGGYATNLVEDKVKDRVPFNGDGVVSSVLFVKGKLFETEINTIKTNKVYDNFDYYEMQSFDDYVTSTKSTKLYENDEFFHITMDDKVYGLSFKDYDKLAGSNHIDTSNLTEILKTSETIETKPKWNIVEHEVVYTNYYRALDLTYFIEAVGSAVLSLPAGTNQELYYEVPNILNFYNYNGSSYELINNQSDESLNLYTHFSNFMKIKVKINDFDLVNSKQSLIKSYAGNMNYGLDDETTIIDYEAGRYLINITNKDLETIESEDGTTIFRLSDEVVNKYSSFKSVYLNIKLDLENIEFGGFDLENNKNFTIYKLTDNDGKNLLISEVMNYA